MKTIELSKYVYDGDFYLQAETEPVHIPIGNIIMYSEGYINNCSIEGGDHTFTTKCTTIDVGVLGTLTRVHVEETCAQIRNTIQLAESIDAVS